MTFNELDKKMRVYEQSLDQVIVPEMFIVVRLDGRSFTKLTKETCKFEAPFDVRFRDMMVNTTKAVMDCGFKVLYGYTGSDEISLLFAKDENTFGRRVNKIISVMAGEASSALSLELRRPVAFDCKISPYPNIELVADHFLWRQEDVHRNALNSYCYWTLRKEGMSERDATKMLEGQSVSYKNELLFSHGINYNDLPSWQKRGTGLWKETYEKDAFDPIAGKPVKAVRNRIAVGNELPVGEEYAKMIKGFLA